MIIRDIKPGIEFFTPHESPLQIGAMKRPKGYVVKAHYHTTGIQEVLFVKSGDVTVTEYAQDGKFLGIYRLTAGDVVLLPPGHGLYFNEESEIVEVKQGPFNNDKVYFE